MSKQKLIITFGHVNFKRICKAQGFDWRECRNISRPEDLRGCSNDNAVVYVASSASCLPRWPMISFELGARGIKTHKV